MKQAIISGLKKKLLLVELSESENRLSIFNDEQPYLSYFIGHDTQRFYLPGKCVLIGKLTDKESFFSKLEADGLNDFDFNKTYLFEIL